MASVLLNDNIAQHLSDFFAHALSTTDHDAIRSYPVPTETSGRPCDAGRLGAYTLRPCDGRRAERRAESHAEWRKIVGHTRASLLPLSTLRSTSVAWRRSYSQAWTGSHLHVVHALAAYGRARWLDETLPKCSLSVLGELFKSTARGDRFDRDSLLSGLIKGTVLHVAVLSCDVATVEVVARCALLVPPARNHPVRSLGRPWRYDAASSLDLLDDHVNTPLILAACKGRVGVVRVLLEVRASTDGFAGRRAVTMVGTRCSDCVNVITPLEVACFRRDEEVAKLLIDRNADVRPIGSVSCTSPLSALLTWASRGSPELTLSPKDIRLANCLIAARAEVNGRGYHNSETLFKSTLFQAVSNGQNNIIPLLLESKADVNQSDGCDTPLHMACGTPCGWNYWAVPLLLEYRADPELRDFDGNKPTLAEYYEEMEAERRWTPTR
jgi:ankyrin repeat protein